MLLIYEDEGTSSRMKLRIEAGDGSAAARIVKILRSDRPRRSERRDPTPALVRPYAGLPRTS